MHSDCYYITSCRKLSSRNSAKKSGLPLDKPEKIVYHKNRKSTSETVCSHN